MNPEGDLKDPQPEEKPEENAESVSLSAKEYEALQAKLSEIETLKDRLLRSAADYENSKKRLTKEREEFLKFGQESLLRSLLPVLDNFERALLHLGDSPETNFKNITAGIQMVFKQFLEVLKAQGLTRLKTAGERFDPHRHEAVGFVQEQGKEDEIVEEVEAGYMLHDRLLRAAKVRVRMRASDSNSSRASSQAPEQEKSEEIT